MLNILIAAGGTGGHLFPARQLADQLKQCNILFAGHKLESSPFFDRNLPYQEIVSTSSKFDVFKLLKGVWQATKLVLKFKPDVVVGFGSFHSFPILMAALLFRKKIVLFEPNASLGQVNRLFSPFAKKIAFQFLVQHTKAVYVPLLPWGQKKAVAKKYEKDPNRICILVFGGSQGASFINKAFCEAARLLSFAFQVIHFTGKEEREMKYLVPAIVKPFEEQMQAAYEVADLVVCRCGAATVAELIRYEKPAVLIPYPFAHDHQKKNGQYLQAGARVLLQKDASAKRLAEEIELLKQNIEMHRAALRQMNHPQTVDLADIVRSVGAKK